MRRIKASLGLFVVALLCGAAAPAFAMHDYGMDSAAFASNDPPGNFFPGKYFQYKAQFYLSKKSYVTALRMYELAGFWANKIAQYNAGLMYYNGIGIPVDRVRGVAWLGIAAEAQDDLAVRALQVAYASLNESEKRQAGELFKQLDEKYGDAASLPRAVRRYEMEARGATGCTSDVRSVGGRSESRARAATGCTSDGRSLAGALSAGGKELAYTLGTRGGGG